MDRKEIVSRHFVRLTRPERLSPLTVGNGEFAFTADITGLQTFPEFHQPGPDDGTGAQAMQLGTLSQWGWHSLPNPENYTLADVLAPYETTRGPVTYAEPHLSEDLSDPVNRRKAQAREYLRTNPHRLDLGRVGLALVKESADGGPVQISDLTHTEQVLDLWQGLLFSQFHFEGQPVKVWTVCHPAKDLLAVRVESPLVRSGRLAVRVAFPYGSGHWFVAADWSKPECHTTRYEVTGSRCDFDRILDDDRYYAALQWSGRASLQPIERHAFELSAPGAGWLEFTLAFSPEKITEDLPSFPQTIAAAARYWEDFWMQGGAVDFSGSSDPRAQELERRVVLSQYLTAINCAGTIPPQETGLVCNSWSGKSHLEMHWWHAAHFVLWGRAHLLERSLPWYQRILPEAQALARRQGYAGARWPKHVDLNGIETPSPISPFLIWQQPHPIYYAELMWRVKPEIATLERYREVVFETAAFMASFPTFDGSRYVLGSPLVPAQESYAKDHRATAINPTYELAYWYWGLETAQRWRERLRLPRDPDWEKVKEGLSRPTIREGIYTAIETPPYTIPTDHPSMLGALGFVPPTPLIDAEIMRRTFQQVKRVWDWPSTWGWDYPLMAMCAARLGDPESAVDALMMEMPKNTYLPNGHNLQRYNLPLYLPGNGGLLMAVAMMAAGWDGAPERPAPGFPEQGWVVQSEGLLPMP